MREKCIYFFSKGRKNPAISATSKCDKERNCNNRHIFTFLLLTYLSFCKKCVSVLIFFLSFFWQIIFVLHSVFLEVKMLVFCTFLYCTVLYCTVQCRYFRIWMVFLFCYYLSDKYDTNSVISTYPFHPINCVTNYHLKWQIKFN